MFKKSMIYMFLIFTMQAQAVDNTVSEEQACEDAKKAFIERCENADRMSYWTLELTTDFKRCSLAYFAMTAKCMKAQERIVERQRAFDRLPYYLD